MRHQTDRRTDDGRRSLLNPPPCGGGIIRHCAILHSTATTAVCCIVSNMLHWIPFLLQPFQLTEAWAQHHGVLVIYAGDLVVLTPGDRRKLVWKGHQTNTDKAEYDIV